MAEISEEKLLWMYRRMVTIRCFEEKASELFYKGEIPGFVHLSLGQEAVPTGTCANLTDQDHITSTHRGHGDIIAKGADVKRMFAELYGRKTGYCKGFGGSMHIADYSIGIIGANGIVGAGLPIATGSALAQKVLGTNSVTVCFFGDGASNQGTFHESLNLAAIWKLPAVYVCENNQYAVSTPAAYSVSVRDISERAKAYGIPGVTVDGNDVIAVYEATKEAIERARRGEGPSLVECKTFRWHGHFEGEEALGWTYRLKEEVEEWKKKDPIPRFENELKSRNILDDQKIKETWDEIRNEIEEAVKFAKESPLAEPEDVFKNIYAGGE